MPHTRRCEIVLLMTLFGLAGCNGASQSAPSSIPSVPQSPTAIEARSIFPESGPTWRDTPVEIAGTGFQPGARVSFGTRLASNIGVINSETIWARSPLHAAGTVDVVVTNFGGQTATMTRAFTFAAIPLPTLTASTSIVAPGGELTVSWATEAPGPRDYIALYAIGASSEEHSIWHHYTSGSTSGTATLNAPNEPGRYEFRYLPDDGHVDVARSPAITVR